MSRRVCSADEPPWALWIPVGAFPSHVKNSTLCQEFPSHVEHFQGCIGLCVRFVSRDAAVCGWASKADEPPCLFGGCAVSVTVGSVGRDADGPQHITMGSVDACGP